MEKKIDKNIENTGLIAISNTLARAKDGMSMQERKLMSIYLSKIEWKNMTNNLEIWVEKREIMNKLGSVMNTTDQSAYLRKLAQGMVRHSELHFDGADKDEWDDMPLFTRRKSTKNMLMIKVCDDAAKLLEGLECDYITLFLADILNFDSNTDGSRAYKLYEYLRLYSDTRRMNTRIISTKEFKELFDIPKDGKNSYVKKNGKFDRTNFEKYVILPVLEMVAKCEHVVLHNYGKDKNGKPIYYKKIKKYGMVQGYELTYSINKYPKKIKKETIIDIQAKPDVLKVAQDVMDSKKSKPPKKNTFNNFEQREYDNDTLERLLLGNPTEEERAELEKKVIVKNELQEKISNRTSKETLVQEYVLAHQNESVSQIAKNLGVSRTTVYKYMNTSDTKPKASKQADKDVKGTLEVPKEQKSEYGQNTKPQGQIPENETPEQRKRRHHMEWQKRMNQ